MVFISMSDTDLLARTAQYQMRDPSLESGDQEPYFSDDASESRPVSRRRDSSAVPPPISGLVARSYRRNNLRTTRTGGRPFSIIDPIDDVTSPRHISSPPELSDFTVITSCNDPSSDEEEESSPSTLADRFRRERLGFGHSSDEDTADGLESNMRRARTIGFPSSNSYYRRTSGRTEPSKIEIVGAANVIGEGSENKEVLAPHARFFIERTRRYVIGKDFILLYSAPDFNHDTNSASQKYLLIPQTLVSNLLQNPIPVLKEVTDYETSIVSLV